MKKDFQKLFIYVNHLVFDDLLLYYYTYYDYVNAGQSLKYSLHHFRIKYV